jgi:hypothetical protein
MRELGQARDVDVLWLLTLSAPEGSWDALLPSFERIAASFAVPVVDEVSGPLAQVFDRIQRGELA